MVWVILTIPGIFSEVISLSLKTPGINAYLPVQLFTGFVFLASFISSMNSRNPYPFYSFSLGLL